MNSIYRNIYEYCVCFHTHGLSGKLQRVVAWKGAEGQEYDLIFFLCFTFEFPRTYVTLIFFYFFFNARVINNTTIIYNPLRS